MLWVLLWKCETLKLFATSSFSFCRLSAAISPIRVSPTEVDQVDQEWSAVHTITWNQVFRQKIILEKLNLGMSTQLELAPHSWEANSSCFAANSFTPSANDHLLIIFFLKIYFLLRFDKYCNFLQSFHLQSTSFCILGEKHHAEIFAFEVLHRSCPGVALCCDPWRWLGFLLSLYLEYQPQKNLGQQELTWISPSALLCPLCAIMRSHGGNVILYLKCFNLMLQSSKTYGFF